ncbi:hypothetical protein JXQ31_02090 [candidate division KSB1 bacterium]|nr:hypothetical protein [candidate division KSB1 bacterium]
MLKSKRIALASIIIIFLSGLVLGIISDRYILCLLPHDDHRRGGKSLVTIFTEELKLTAEQQEKLKELLKELRENHDKIRKSVEPEYRRLRKQFDDDFSQILDEIQKKKFIEFNNRIREKRKRNE